MDQYYCTAVLMAMIIVWPCLHFFIIPNLLLLLIKSDPKSPKMPPGPYPFPIIGNILKLGQKPHQTLSELSKIYGPLMTLKFGSLTTIVISSPQIAKEALIKNDIVFSDRQIPDIMHALDHHKVSMVWLPTSSIKWRNLRKICATNVFSHQKLDSTRDFRHKKVQELLNFVHISCTKCEPIDIGQAAFTTVINSLSYTFFSRDFVEYGPCGCVPQNNYRGLMTDIMEESGKTNFADLFPLLRLFDPQGVRRRGKDYTQRLIRLFNGIVDERMQLRASCIDSGEDNRDVLDSFLSLMEVHDSAELSRREFLHLMVDLFVAGTDTTTSTVEWAMAELLNNPEKMAKAKEELIRVLGKEGKPEELDISKLPYLKAIVKETFRLHPPVPFLHHKSKSEAEICGFRVPKDAQVLVNVWAIGRNSNVWSDPNCFVPERFLGCKMNVNGHDFELIPFGSGRRMCPGLPLAHRSVHLILASLLHCFDWKIANVKKQQEFDMTEKYGLALRRDQPLLAIPINI
ncbi:geraniol 8-hydroxylase-like [Abrus precatorius]|uniref:Geraniol 8-hydroxylase-like n=1 Tax=Abrus precatorius TaxID=3816 RepID=A0A8B8K0V5_ABRPR|nr:geraniol 8-hydroxylase-like [Abrus precatorius]